jgi:ribosome-binding protein aMBF1 (putative translation factor)
MKLQRCFLRYTDMKNIEWDILQVRKAVCRKIARALMARGLSQKQFAVLWDRPESQVSKMLNAQMDLRLSTMTEIEQLLGIEIIKKN